MKESCTYKLRHRRISSKSRIYTRLLEFVAMLIHTPCLEKSILYLDLAPPKSQVLTERDSESVVARHGIRWGRYFANLDVSDHACWRGLSVLPTSR